MTHSHTQHEEYQVSTQAYLKRARDQLSRGSAQSLFYAAFELRCFVESRQNEYLEAQKAYARSIPRHWKIGQQGAALYAIFKSERIQFVSWRVGDDVIFEAHYVPVAGDLRKAAQKQLGDLLHAQNNVAALNETWWKKTAADLHNMYELAWQCSQGRLLSPMMLVDGQGVGAIQFDVAGDAGEKFLANMKVGVEGVMEVRYLDSIPEGWVSDLLVENREN